MFTADVKSTLLSQLTGKHNPEEQECVGYGSESIVFILGDTRILGIGICVKGASVLVHKSILENKKVINIYIRDKNQKAIAEVRTIEEDVALMLVRNRKFH